jgi:hypothetical protein
LTFCQLCSQTVYRKKKRLGIWNLNEFLGLGNSGARMLPEGDWGDLKTNRPVFIPVNFWSFSSYLPTTHNNIIEHQNIIFFAESSGPFPFAVQCKQENQSFRCIVNASTAKQRLRLCV